MNNISDETKVKIISGLKTFATSFLVAAATIIVSDSTTIDWTYAFWGSIAVAGVRAGITSVIAPYLPIKLGGKK